MKLFRALVLLACAAVFAIAVLQSGDARAETKTLYLYNWSQYMSPKILKAFKEKYHVNISRNFYESNAQLFAKLHAGGDSQYDVVFPSYYFIPRLIKTNLIQPLDRKLVPNLDNLLPRFKNSSYDPHNTYSAPYQWGDDGIAYDAKDFPNPPRSWGLIFDPKVNSDYPFAMMTETQVMFGAACAYLGLGYDCNTREDWKKAARLLMETRKRHNFSGFMHGTPTLKRISRGIISAGPVFNGDYAFDKKNNPEEFADIKFMVPKEGGELWVDTMAIPAHAPHPDLANKFINFVLSAKMGAELSNYNSYASPNKAAQPYLKEELSKPPIMPTEEVMKTLRVMPVLKGEDLQFMQQLWTEIQSN